MAPPSPAFHFSRCRVALPFAAEEMLLTKHCIFQLSFVQDYHSLLSEVSCQ